MDRSARRISISHADLDFEAGRRSAFAAGQKPTASVAASNAATHLTIKRPAMNSLLSQ
jgi:hypothetical protein